MKKNLIYLFIFMTFITGCNNSNVNNNSNKTEIEQIQETNKENINSNKKEESQNNNTNNSESTVTNNNSVNKNNNSNNSILTNNNNNNNSNNSNNANIGENVSIIKDNNKNDNVSNSNDSKNDNISENYIYVGDSLNYEICPDSKYYRSGDGCYTATLIKKEWGCDGNIIDGKCYGVYKDQSPQYYCNPGDLYYEHNGVTYIERKCRKKVTEVVSPRYDGSCLTDYTLNSDGMCEITYHSYIGMYDAYVLYNCPDGYTLHGDLCMKEKEFSYLYNCPDGYDTKFCSIGTEDCICAIGSSRTDFIKVTGCGKDNDGHNKNDYTLINGKCYIKK